MEFTSGMCSFALVIGHAGCGGSNIFCILLADQLMDARRLHSRAEPDGKGAVRDRP